MHGVARRLRWEMTRGNGVVRNYVQAVRTRLAVPRLPLRAALALCRLEHREEKLVLLMLKVRCATNSRRLNVAAAASQSNPDNHCSIATQTHALSTCIA